MFLHISLGSHGAGSSRGVWAEGLQGCVVVHGFSGFGGFRVPALGTSGGEFPRCFADKSEVFGLRVLGALGFRHPKIPLTGVKERAYGLPDCRLSPGLRVELRQCAPLTQHQSSNRLTGSPEESAHTHTRCAGKSENVVPSILIQLSALLSHVKGVCRCFGDALDSFRSEVSNYLSKFLAISLPGRSDGTRRRRRHGGNHDNAGAGVVLLAVPNPIWRSNLETGQRTAASPRS